MRAFDVVVDDKWIELDRLATSIKLPKTYGTFTDDKHYLATLDLLLASTSETENRNNFFIKNVIPYVTYQSMIDIGLGDGKLTALVGKKFKEITIVDTSLHALHSVEKNINLTQQKLHKIVGSFENINLAANQFDLAMLSHTLYYIDTSLWIDVAIKLISSLKENGLLVIVLNGGLDKDTAANQFGGKPLEIDHFIENCCTQLSVKSIDVSYSIEYFKTKSLVSMLHIAGLHLFDVGATATKDELADYLIARMDKITQLYQFMVFQKFIVIRK